MHGGSTHTMTCVLCLYLPCLLQRTSQDIMRTPGRVSTCAHLRCLVTVYVKIPLPPFSSSFRFSVTGAVHVFLRTSCGSSAGSNDNGDSLCHAVGLFCRLLYYAWAHHCWVPPFILRFFFTYLDASSCDTCHGFSLYLHICFHSFTCLLNILFVVNGLTTRWTDIVYSIYRPLLRVVWFLMPWYAVNFHTVAIPHSLLPCRSLFTSACSLVSLYLPAFPICLPAGWKKPTTFPYLPPVTCVLPWPPPRTFRICAVTSFCCELVVCNGFCMLF